jgi:hypothetical protein
MTYMRQESLFLLNGNVTTLWLFNAFSISLLLYCVVMIASLPHPAFPPQAGCDRLVSELMVIEN